MKADLTGRGVAMQPGIGALQLRQNLLMQGGARTPEWSAAVPGQPTVQIYQTGSIIVVCWTSAAARPGTFVIATGPNPDKAKLQEIPKKQLPVKGARVFADATSAPWVATSRVVPTFITRFAKQYGWQLVHTEGNCYLFGYQGTWAGLDDAVRTAGQFEQALASG
jgi:hypothetical protein